MHVLSCILLSAITKTCDDDDDDDDDDEYSDYVTNTSLLSSSNTFIKLLFFLCDVFNN